MPLQVLSEVSLNLAHFDRMHMREEWDSLREHDVVFLVSIQSPHVSQEEEDNDTTEWDLSLIYHVKGTFSRRDILEVHKVFQC